MSSHTSVPTGELFAGPHRTLGRAGPVPLLVVGLPTVVPLPLPTPTCIMLAPPEMSQVQNSRPQAEGPAAIAKAGQDPLVAVVCAAAKTYDAHREREEYVRIGAADREEKENCHWSLHAGDC